MKYLCLICIDEKEIENTPPEKLAALKQECYEHVEKLERSGQYIAGGQLQSVQTATTVRTRNGNVSVTDGPFAETKEQLAGFYLIEARDLNEAIRIASNIPPGRLGSVEVRPVATDGRT